MISVDCSSALLMDISEYAEIEPKKAVAIILQSTIAFFLDTCFISRLRYIKEDKRYLYFRNNWDGGKDICFVITGTVLYELKDSQEDKLQKENKVTLEDMTRQGFKIVVLCEEKIVSCLKEYSSYRATDWIGFFDQTVLDNKAVLRKISSVLETDKELAKCSKSDYNFVFLEKQLTGIKKRKDNKDSLADELIMICFMFFLKLPGRTKYCYCTTDYYAIANLNKFIDNSCRRTCDRVERLDFFNLIKKLHLNADLSTEDRKWIIELFRICFGENVRISKKREYGFVSVITLESIENLVGMLEDGIDISFEGQIDVS